MMSLATVDDLRLHWPALPDEKQAEAQYKLLEASMIVRAMYPWVDQRIASGVLALETVVYVVCDMVKTALDVTETETPSNVSQASFTAGPFTQNLSYRSTEGNLFLTKLHRQLLTGGGSRNRRAFMIVPGA